MWLPRATMKVCKSCVQAQSYPSLLGVSEGLQGGECVCCGVIRWILWSRMIPGVLQGSAAPSLQP